ncbi:MAG: hypothetical protein EA378_00345 [Phycisphaerales bacterium]|nr:MAG: hypothetical protein EA378_00345 [Phycisphaerales bacterium]
MAVTVQQARRYCTTSEIELIAMSTPRQVGELTPARLRQKLARARKLRDKFRDLGDRQKREMRGKGEPRGQRGAQSNEATRLKQQVFAETVERFEAALVKAEAKQERAASSKQKAVAKKTSKKKAAGKKLSKKATKKKVAKKAGKKRVGKNQGGATLTKKASRKKAVRRKVGKAGVRKKARKKISKKAASLMAVASESARLSVVPDESRALRVENAINRGGKRRMDAHVSSRGRRQQAARDNRG